LPSPVDWTIMPKLAQAIGMRRDGQSGTTVILMAPLEDCYAIATPEQGEGHYSMYLALFGRTIQAGQSARARARLVVSASPSEKQVVKMYKAYIKGLT